VYLGGSIFDRPASNPSPIPLVFDLRFSCFFIGLYGLKERSTQPFYWYCSIDRVSAKATKSGEALRASPASPGEALTRFPVALPLVPPGEALTRFPVALPLVQPLRALIRKSNIRNGNWVHSKKNWRLGRRSHIEPDVRITQDRIPPGIWYSECLGKTLPHNI